MGRAHSRERPSPPPPAAVQLRSQVSVRVSFLRYDAATEWLATLRQKTKSPVFRHSFCSSGTESLGSVAQNGSAKRGYASPPSPTLQSHSGTWPKPSSAKEGYTSHPYLTESLGRVAKTQQSQNRVYLPPRTLQSHSGAWPKPSSAKIGYTPPLPLPWSAKDACML